MKKKTNLLSLLLLMLGLVISVDSVFFTIAIQRRIAEFQRQTIQAENNVSKSIANQAALKDTYAALIAEEQASIQTATDLFLQAQKIPAAVPEEPVSESNGLTVAIDPGHQGWHVDMSDKEPLGPGSSEMKAKASTGTSGTYSGLAEFELNLTIAKQLRSILEERGYTVVLTREDNDTAISNAERAQLATESGADIYVRIHANGDDSHTVSGALTMVPSSSNPFVSYLASDSYRLGQCILDSYCQATGFSSHGVQYYDNMTGINWSTVPVTIIEMGFMTYESDDLKMADPDFQLVMATGIADGIDAYFADELQ